MSGEKDDAFTITGPALPCDAYHHYYHYQSSAQYLWLAESLRALARGGEALAAYGRAIFQDHFNAEALEGKKNVARDAWRVPHYDKHPPLDATFLASIGQPSGVATQAHDDAVAAISAGDGAKALALLEDAIAADPLHSNSFFTRGKWHFLRKDYEQAHADFTQAVRLSHLNHDAYHHAASDAHLARGRQFLERGELDLAVSDFTKALDLHKGNTEALKARAETYRKKGNRALAEEDETKSRRT